MAGILNDASSSATELLPARQQRPILEITALHKRFGAVEVLRDVSLAVTPGEAFDAPGFLRISYATSIEELKRGTERILTFMRSLESRKAVAG